ncbi:MAG TPA: hypothetical protein VN363_03420 [Anaerolineales bacterium]|nr:hypothetical protein [Anaerolineales bacterium]
MYVTVLAIHNIVRWVIVILGVLAVLRAFIGWLGKQAWIPADRKIGSFIAMALDIQVLLGLILYIFFSPFGLQAFRNSNFSSIMGQREISFFAIEHPLIMILAVVFAHLGVSQPRKAEKPNKKHRLAAIWFGLALVLILLGMPWARPLFPAFG